MNRVFGSVPGPRTAYGCKKISAMHATHLTGEPLADGIEPSRERVEAVFRVLAAALHAFDRYTAEHSCESSLLAGQVAARLGVGAEQAELIAQVAAVHDIGKVGIPSAILHKPGPLTEEEFALVRQHPVIGEQILLRVPELADVARAVRHEHERWDGRGYPDGLGGTAIPLASRVVLACDSWNAMTSDRPYRPAMMTQAAAAELERCSGTQFDPQVVRALLEVLLDTGRAGA